MRGWKLWLCVAFAAVSTAAISVAYSEGEAALRPARRGLTSREILEASAAFDRANAKYQDFVVAAADGASLKGWLAYPADTPANTARDWVLLFHGVADNRMGVLGLADFLLRRGYGVVMMDSRAQGESGGAQATYGWQEHDDVKNIVNQLETRFPVQAVFELGVSMGASIALESAAYDSRIAGVVAEAPFCSLREASYDYVGLHESPLLGRTLLRPAVAAGIYAMEKDGGFSVDEISPERAVTQRSFSILLIGDGDDRTLPLRHVRRIYASAIGPKQIWIVPNAPHAMGFGTEPTEYEEHVLAFFANARPHN
jgi:pimeloyl-ACP methyl ester carboxylesterase